MPIPDSLASHYKDQIEFYIIDPLDKFPKDSMLLLNYQKNLKTEYTTFALCDISYTYSNQLDIHSFPTILLINAKGEIVYRMIGYSEDLYALLEDAIYHALKK